VSGVSDLRREQKSAKVMKVLDRQTDVSGSDLSRVVRNDCYNELCLIDYDICFEWVQKYLNSKE
jgi:hypothetical protein